MVLICKNWNTLRKRMLCARLGANKPCDFGEDLSMYFSVFRNGRDPSFECILILFTQGCFVPSLFEIGPVVLERIFFSILYFRSCLVISS